MKKLLGMVVLGLLIANTSFAKALKIYYADENLITMQDTFMYNKQHKTSAKHCAKYKKFALDIWDMDKPNKKVTHYCVNKFYSTFKGQEVRWTNFDANSDFVRSTNSSSSSSSTGDKIAQSKKICKELGFKTNSEKFADCALRMMSLQFETGSKVSNNDGSSTQKIIVQQQDNFDIGDFFFGLQKIVDDNYRSTKNSSSTSSTGQNCRIYERQWGAEVKCK